MENIRYEVTIGDEVITNAIVPFKFMNVLDATLDYAMLEITGVKQATIPPLTQVLVKIYSDNAYGGEQVQEFEYLVSTDDSTIAFLPPENSAPRYHHTLQLIEPTKWGEGFNCDNLCVTHPGGNVYTENATPVIPEED